jgi:hypothetical protein
MTNPKVQEIQDELVPLRAKLDQLCAQADAEGFQVKRETTEALLEALNALKVLEDTARLTRNTRLVSSVLVERDRAREAVGINPRRRRRRS